MTLPTMIDISYGVLCVAVLGSAVTTIGCGGSGRGSCQDAVLLDGHPIARVETVPCSYPETYDILPASESGDYFAAGMLIGSILAR